MSNALHERGASAALAAFAVAPHDGGDFAQAAEAARALLGAARTAAAHDERPDALDAAVSVAYGAPMRAAFFETIRLIGAGIGRDEAAIVAVVRAASPTAEAGDATAVRAVAVGREAVARLADTMDVDPAWDGVAVGARIGAAAAAACAAGLDAGRARDAIGIAATQASGLRVASESRAGTLTFAKIAADAVEAAALARHGFTAAPASLEGRRGLAALMTSAFDEAAFCEGLGSRWISARD